MLTLYFLLCMRHEYVLLYTARAPQWPFHELHVSNPHLSIFFNPKERVKYRILVQKVTAAVEVLGEEMIY